MPVITFSGIDDSEGWQIECPSGTNLRRALMDAELPLYNGAAAHIHCRGLGTCGTCAVQVQGLLSDPTAIELWRLNFPPHNQNSGLRLACQAEVLGDVTVNKHSGLWGQKLKD